MIFLGLCLIVVPLIIVIYDEVQFQKTQTFEEHLSALKVVMGDDYTDSRK